MDAGEAEAVEDVDEGADEVSRLPILTGSWHDLASWVRLDGTGRTLGVWRR